MLNKGKVVVYIILISFISIVRAEYLLYKHNPELSPEEDKYLSLELNTTDWLKADDTVVLEKYYKLKNILQEEDKRSIKFKIHVARSLILLAQVLDDNQKIFETFEDYFEKYAVFDKKNSYYLRGSFCTFRQLTEEDKDQVECFKKTIKLYNENYALKVFNDPFYPISYKGAFQRYQMIIIEYLAKDREYSNKLCSIISDFKNNLKERDLSNYKNIMYDINNDLKTYKYMKVLTEKDYDTLGCLDNFLID